MRRKLKTTIRSATLVDARLIWQWRNDPLVRKHSLNHDRIPWKKHRAWYLRKLKAPDTRIWILATGGVPAAMARYDGRSRGEVELSFSVAPAFRGNGLGRAVMEKTLPLVAHHLKVRNILARVKEDNRVSRTLLEHLGFEETAHVVAKGWRCVQMRKRI